MPVHNDYQTDVATGEGVSLATKRISSSSGDTVACAGRPRAADRAAPVSEAGSALFVSIIQVAIALGSLFGGVVVDHVGISAYFLFGSGLALLGLAALASFGRSE